jgi:hypothetical protein
LPVVLYVVFFDGTCGFNLGFLGGSYSCTLPEALLSSDGLVLFMGVWFIILWWVVLIILVVSVFGTYFYYKKERNLVQRTKRVLSRLRRGRTWVDL